MADPLVSTEDLHAAADQFVDSVLIDTANKLRSGYDLQGLTAHIGCGLIEMDAAPKELTILLARTLARLGRLRFAVDAAADLWMQAAQVMPTHPVKAEDEVSPQERAASAETLQLCAEDLQKLVADHG